MIDSAAYLSQARDAMAMSSQTRLGANGSARGQVSVDEARKVGKEFEAFFVGQMLDLMSAGIKSDGLFGGGQGEEVWRSMLNQEYGKEIAKRGGFGIADHVVRSLIQAQGEATDTGNMTAQASAAQYAAALGATAKTSDEVQ